MNSCNTDVYDIVVQLKRRIFNYFVHCVIVLCMGVESVVSSVCVCICVYKKAVLFLLL